MQHHRIHISPQKNKNSSSKNTIQRKQNKSWMKQSSFLTYLQAAEQNNVRINGYVCCCCVSVLTSPEGGLLTLPEGEKDDWFDHEELEYWVVRDKQFTRSKVEEEESVERQTDGDVVDNGDIQVTTSHAGGERHRHQRMCFSHDTHGKCLSEETKKR